MVSRVEIQLELMAGPYLVARVDSGDQNCLGLIGRCDGELVSVTTTADEISLVIKDSISNRALFPDVKEIESGWRAFRIVGPLPFHLVGILADLASVLATADIPVFCLSTFLTDYILVKARFVETATEQLRIAGYSVTITP